MVGAEAKGIKIIKRFAMDVLTKLASVHEVIPESVQMAARGHGAIKVTDRTRRGVAAVSKCRLAFFKRPLIEFLEAGFRHIDFAPYFKGAQLFDMHRNRTDGDHVRGDVFSRHTIATSHGVLERPTIIDEAHAKTIDLDLAHIVHDIDA